MDVDAEGTRARPVTRERRTPRTTPMPVKPGGKYLRWLYTWPPNEATDLEGPM